MGTRESYDEALARRLALLRAELTGERAAAERARERAAAEAAGPAPVADPAAVAEPVETAIKAPGRHASRRFPLADRIPGALLGPGPVAVVAVLVALGLGLAAWLALRSQPEELPLAAPVAGELVSPVAVPGASTAAEVSTTPAEVVVHVAGKVRRPGIVVLEPGARVIDAVEAAGGLRRGVDLTGVNLARLLTDGEQVLVGTGVAGAPASGVAGPGDAATAGKVNLNTASAAQLEELPGVGPVTAAAIVAFREEHGPFASVDQLLDVSGIGEATLAEIAPAATV
jgi:competence protein ComEA